jgi:hypothetical protein
LFLSWEDRATARYGPQDGPPVVETRSYFDLHIKGTPKDDGAVSQKLLPCVWEDRFDSCYHGVVGRVVNLDELTMFSVKIT